MHTSFVNFLAFECTIQFESHQAKALGVVNCLILIEPT